MTHTAGLVAAVAVQARAKAGQDLDVDVSVQWPESNAFGRESCHAVSSANERRTATATWSGERKAWHLSGLQRTASEQPSPSSVAFWHRLRYNQRLECSSFALVAAACALGRPTRRCSKYQGRVCVLIQLILLRARRHHQRRHVKPAQRPTVESRRRRNHRHSSVWRLPRTSRTRACFA